MWDGFSSGLQPPSTITTHNIIYGPTPPIFPNFVPHLHWYTDSRVRVPPYAHPQHVMVLNLNHVILYIYDMDVGWIQRWQWSTASQPLHQNIICGPASSIQLSNICQPPSLRRVLSYAHPQHMIVLKHFIHTRIWMWDAFSSGLWSQP